MRFVIVTGVSGAGKTAALKMLEDMNYFCVDNPPIQLLEKFASLLPEMQSENVRNVALGIDARSGSALDELEVVLDRMKQTGYDYEILFMDAEDSVLVKRYKESRRSHPLARTGRVDEGIRLEREKTKFLRKRADYIIDTSHLLTRELRQEIEKIFVDDREFSNIMISVLSFGFKYGIPADADLVFDVRFLPNPYYVDELRHDLMDGHPEIKLIDFDFYDTEAFNECDRKNALLMAVPQWEAVHPLLKILPVRWDYTVPYGLLYGHKPSAPVKRFLHALAQITERFTKNEL